MNIYLGSINFDQVEDKLGYRLTEGDRELWNKYHNDKADLSGMDNCFHIFHLPTEIHFKGEEAKQAILTMFARDKLIASKGKFGVREKA